MLRLQVKPFHVEQIRKRARIKGFDVSQESHHEICYFVTFDANAKLIRIQSYLQSSNHHYLDCCLWNWERLWKYIGQWMLHKYYGGSDNTFSELPSSDKSLLLL